MEKLFEIYYGFGKGEGFEISSREVMKDTEENRRDLIENEFSYWDETTNKEEFIKGESNKADFSRDGVDWDEATVAYIVALTYEEKLEEIEKQKEKEIKRLNELFNK